MDRLKQLLAEPRRSISALLAGDTSERKLLLTRFYEKHNPENVKNVNSYLQSMSWGSINTGLKDKYGESAEELAAAPPAPPQNALSPSTKEIHNYKIKKQLEQTVNNGRNRAVSDSSGRGQRLFAHHHSPKMTRTNSLPTEEELRSPRRIARAGSLPTNMYNNTTSRSPRSEEIWRRKQLRWKARREAELAARKAAADAYHNSENKQVQDFSRFGKTYHETVLCLGPVELSR